METRSARSFAWCCPSRSPWPPRHYRRLPYGCLRKRRQPCLECRLQEAVEDLARHLVDLEHVADQEMDAVVIGDQQRSGADAADVFFPFQHELGRATVGFHVPG